MEGWRTHTRTLTECCTFRLHIMKIDFFYFYFFCHFLIALMDLNEVTAGILCINGELLLSN